MPTPRRRHPAWSAGLAIVALLLVGLVPGAHGASWHSPPTARAVSAVGHAVSPSAARPASVRHASASTPSLQHLDLTTPPAADPTPHHAAGWLAVLDAPGLAPRGSAVIAHGRAPPAL